MNNSTSRLTLVSFAFSIVVGCALSEGRADVRRGILYDILHFGRGGDPSRGLEVWLGNELEGEKVRIKEDVRFYRMHLYLHNLDHKKLLHPECSPYHDCYLGTYPTCWRPFPGQQYCPTPVSDPVNYEPEGHKLAPYGAYPPVRPELWEAPLNGPEAEPEPQNVAPPAPQAPPESDAPLYFE